MAAWPLLNSGQRKRVLVAGVLVTAAWILYPSSEPPAATPTPVVKPTVAAGKQPVMPKGFQQQSVIRDPFQQPQPVLPGRPDTDAAADGSTSIAAPLPLRLTGIAIGNGTAAAILESKADSRSYRVGDYAGRYQIRDITRDTVLLDGPDGRHVLYMGRRP